MMSTTEKSNQMQVHRAVQWTRAPLSLALIAIVVGGLATAVAHAQNPSMPFTLPQTTEPPVSPVNPGTLPGSTSAVGTNPITGLPCNGAGSVSVTGAGGLFGAAPPVGTANINQVPIGSPPTTSIYGSQSSLGSC